MRFLRVPLACVFVLLLAAHCSGAPETGSRLHYRVLSANSEVAPPFAAVDFVYGPEEKFDGHNFRWWQIELRAQAGQTNTPLCIVRCLTSGNPLEGTREGLQIARYQLQIPETGEALEYVEIHSGQALLPSWENFQKYFLPHAASFTQRQNSAPETCEFLGQILTLQNVQADSWPVWPNVKRLELDREVLVGTGRNFKDQEGKRLSQTPKPQDYTYINFKAEDYRTMIDAGMNLFTIAPDQEQWVRDEPVFYLCPEVRKPPLNYPANLYRPNFLGAGMFMDEPASILTWDKYASGLMSHFSDVAAVLETRTRATFQSSDLYYGCHGLEKQLIDLGVNLGDMRLAQTELPVWETQYDRTFYLMKGGGSGIVHEGRYQLDDFNRQVSRFTGKDPHYTAHQMLQYYYSFLRGGTRPFGKYWGTAIYGQCDPKIAPEAFTLAYDMGARYFWFWTSDHGHHVPWAEQVELSRMLKQHARQHPRPSIFATSRKHGIVIAVPNGCFLSFGSLSGLRGIEQDGKNAASQSYHRLMQHALEAVDDCFQRGQDFDITVADGHRIEGYKRIIKITE